MRIGFACAWDDPPERTWSYTPWNLFNAMKNKIEVVDFGPKIGRVQRLALKALYTKRRNNRWVSTWNRSSLWDFVCTRYIINKLKEHDVAAVLEIGDLAQLPVPFYLYQDLSYDVLERYYDKSHGVPGFPGLSIEIIRKRRDRQRKIYEQAAGVFAMSAWFASTLIKWTGLPPKKVHVVHAGINAAVEPKLVLQAKQRMGTRRGRLLFVGRDFWRKGGDLCVRALELLRREYSHHVTLTIAGPPNWPMPGPVPEGISFLGQVPIDQVGQLFEDHDLFVMPSRFEPFGIVFAEAIAHGLPCIGRNAFAMPEIITPGHNGELLEDDNIYDLAELIVKILENDKYYTAAQAESYRAAAYFSWNRVADDMIRVMAGP
ncbi:glycosyltransferase family 4 protein [Thermanaeromonas sp. C210]|uniref:glycosyltransferase family 4 protein n=1 Tax=Thermanaeromonas sp. C210 TaxID=2731925 RepID=UPI00155D3E0C|nr:glycosyltransferase family 4 protein [Thermanaeromonas sp. C210]GFN23660.1 hypothetical protein TAMC210_19770 [Thermanaeromonas sp. C210]